MTENMKMTINKEAKKNFVKKVKKQRDIVPEIKMEDKIKSEKMLDEMSQNNIKKKKRKLAMNADIINSGDPDAEVVHKKKKKLIKNDTQSETADLLHQEESSKGKKKIKNKSMQTESNEEIVKLEKVVNNDMDKLQKDKNQSKKAKKAKKQIVVTDTQQYSNRDIIKQKDKKKKTKQLAEEEDIIETVTTKESKKNKSELEKEIKTECPESHQVENVKVKKKKTKDKAKAEENKEKTHMIKNIYSTDVKKDTDENDSFQVKKKNHKKTKSEKKLDVVVDSENYNTEKDTVDLTDNPEPKKKKKKKTPEENDKKHSFLDPESDAISKGKQQKCSKQSKIHSEAGAGQKKKKKKIKEEKHDPEEPSQVEVVFLSEKTGNADEVNINKERRQALQMEIDEASQPQKPPKPLGLGQWGTAEFGSSEQQQKFLRLMGGFKKGFQPASSSSGGGNMALGRDAQQQLQQGLLGQFERAHSRRMDSSNRGAGLGFTAPSKKFSIDANITRSVRFDD